MEEIIQTAITQKMHTFCLTEHMPRGKEDFYPEEVRPPAPPVLEYIHLGHY
jgi:histidinol-phosphatase (PHP family)